MLKGTVFITDIEATTRTASPMAPASASATAEASFARRPDQTKGVKPGGLVLTRHLGESIMIGESVEVQVVGLQGGKVRIKVIAPRDIAVHRREVFDAIRAETGQPGPSAPR